MSRLLVGTTLLAAVMSMLLTGAVGHGILRPLLEARGIAPWRLRDSLGSLLLVLLGAGVLGGTAVGTALWHGSEKSSLGVPDLLSLALLSGGALMVRLGLLSLRKLT
jgi:hypothetical protein